MSQAELLFQQNEFGDFNRRGALRQRRRGTWNQQIAEQQLKTNDFSEFPLVAVVNFRHFSAWLVSNFPNLDATRRLGRNEVSSLANVWHGW